MKLENWKPFYKINPDDGQLIETNLIYTPLISPDGKIFCMSFDHTNKYQNEDLAHWLPSRPYYNEEMVKFFFDREIKYMTVFAKYKWAPRIINVDSLNQQIFFEWPGETCNQIIYSNRNLEDYCPDWEQQLSKIIHDVYHAGYLKISLYPHCFFIDNGMLRTFDFYGCCTRSNPYIDINLIRGMIGETSTPRFEEATESNMLNLEILFNRALEHYVVWPNNALQTIYRKLK